MFDMLVWGLIIFLGTILLISGMLLSYGMIYQGLIVGGVFLMLLFGCGGPMFLYYTSWEENWPWFFICGGFLAIFVFAVTIWGWRAYSRNANRPENLQQE